MLRLRKRVVELVSKANTSSNGSSSSSTNGTSSGGNVGGQRPTAACKGARRCLIDDAGHLVPASNQRVRRKHTSKELASKLSPSRCALGQTDGQWPLSLPGLDSGSCALNSSLFCRLVGLIDQWMTRRMNCLQESARPWPQRAATECWTESLGELLARLCEQSPELAAQRLRSSACGWGEPVAEARLASTVCKQPLQAGCVEQMPGV